MNYRIWYSTEPFADFVIDNTDLRNKTFVKKKMYESDANNARTSIQCLTTLRKFFIWMHLT